VTTHNTTLEDVIMTGDLSNLSPEVKNAIKGRYGHHRTPWFENILSSLTGRLDVFFGKSYSTVIITGTRLQAHEAIRQNFNKPLAIIDGVSKGGERVDFKDAISKNKGRSVIFDLSDIFGADLFNPKGIEADGYLVVPERALMGIPGIVFLVLHKDFIEKIKKQRENLPIKPYALDLLRYLSSLEGATTPFSPNISASVAIEESLAIIEASGGMVSSTERHLQISNLIRKYLKGWRFKLNDRNQTNAFTLCVPPKNISIKALRAALAKRGVRTTLSENKLKIGHCGYIDNHLLNKAVKALHDALIELSPNTKFEAPTDILLSGLDNLHRKEGSIPLSEVFSIDPKEFIELGRKKSLKTKDEVIIRKVSASVEKIFRSEYSQNDIYQDRTIGFVGAGNIVKITVELCRKLGLKNIVVYSPSLSKKKNGVKEDKNNHKTRAYWESREVKIAQSVEEIFLTCHTVILLPFVYTKEAVEIFGKGDIYYNVNLINKKLLGLAEKSGKLDILINTSARESLIDRKALSHHLKKGWLLYYSDEMPTFKDPIVYFDNSIFTGHVGGSPKAPQRRVAENSHRILRELINSIKRGVDLNTKTKDGYSLSIINNLIDPRTAKWRYKNIPKNTGEIRVLLTDSFDLSTLNFPALESKGLKISVKDISSDSNRGRLGEVIKEFRPHVMFIRSQTKIGNDIALVADKVPELSAIIRPGVGIDNLYESIAKLNKMGILIINEPYGNSFAVAEMTMHFILNATERIFLTPGPTRFLPELFDTRNLYTHPTSPLYQKVKKDLIEKMREFLDIKNESRLFIVSGPSTYSMEAAIKYTTKIGDRGLIVSHGKFGTRFKDISISLGRDVTALEMADSDWGKAFSPKDIDEALRNSKRKHAYLCFQQNETSSGVSYKASQIRSIARIARRHNPSIVIIMDAVSGAFAHELSLDKLGIDVAIIGSQKAVGISSGISFVFFSKHGTRPEVLAWEKVLNKDTESVFHIISAANSLEKMAREGGIKSVVERHGKLARLSRTSLKKLGLKILTQKEYLSDAITPFIVPSNFEASVLRKKIENEFGIVLAGAQSAFWKKNMVRIGTMGFIYETHILRALRALRIILKK